MTSIPVRELGVRARTSRSGGSDNGRTRDRAILSAVYARGADSYDTSWSPVILPPAESVVAALDLGSNRARLAALEPERRDQVLSEVRGRLARLQPSDYAFRGKLVCSVSETST